MADEVDHGRAESFASRSRGSTNPEVANLAAAYLALRAVVDDLIAREQRVDAGMHGLARKVDEAVLLASRTRSRRIT